MYNRQYELWSSNQYQNPNVAQAVPHQSTPQASYQRNVNVNTYQESNQLAGWDTVQYSDGPGNQMQHESTQYPGGSQQEQSRSQYQQQSYYESENYQQEGWLNYNNNNNNNNNSNNNHNISNNNYNTNQQYVDYNYSQNNANYDSSNYGNMTQNSMSSSYDQRQVNYSQPSTYTSSASDFENGMNVGYKNPATYESPLQALEERRTDSTEYDVPTSFFSKKLGSGKKLFERKEKEDFRRPAPVKIDADIPADIAALFQTNHCKMCDVKLNSRVQSEMHYVGKPHAKKLKTTLDKRFGRTPVREEQANPDPITAPSAPITVKPSTTFMEFVPASGGRSTLSVDISTCMGIGGGSSSGGMSGVILSQMPGQKKGLGFVNDKKKNKKKKRPDYTAREQSSDYAPGDDSSDCASSPKKKKKVISDFDQLYCKCCDLSFTSQEHAKEHFLGRNHQRVLHGLKPLRPSDPVTPTELLKHNPDGTVNPEKLKGKGKFFCDLCGVATTSSDQLHRHMTGVRHMQMARKAGEAENAGETDDVAMSGGENQNPNTSGDGDDSSSLPMSFFSKKLGFSDNEGSTATDKEGNIEFDNVGLPTSFFSKKLTFGNKNNSNTNTDIKKTEKKPKAKRGGGNRRKQATGANATHIDERNEERPVPLLDLNFKSIQFQNFSRTYGAYGTQTFMENINPSFSSLSNDRMGFHPLYNPPSYSLPPSQLYVPSIFDNFEVNKGGPANEFMMNEGDANQKKKKKNKKKKKKTNKKNTKITKESVYVAEGMVKRYDDETFLPMSFFSNKFGAFSTKRPKPETQPQPVPVSEDQTNPVPVSESKTDPVPVSEDQTNPVPVSESKTDPVPVSESQTNPVPVSESQANPVPVSEGQTNPVPVSEGQTNPVPVSESQTNPVSVSKGKSNPVPVSESQTNPVSVSEGQTNPVSTSEGQTNPVAVSESQTNPVSKPEPERLPDTGSDLNKGKENSSKQNSS